MSTVLVTGGAGYIGAHACKALKQAGYEPVAFDNLSTGWREAVRFGPFFEGDLLNREHLANAFEEYRPDAVMHFGALSQVGESVREPEKYWRNNVVGSLNLVQAMIGAGCLRMVFSSTCAVYGEQDGILLDEESETWPVSPYATTKLAIENMLEDFRRSAGLEFVAFRYFNVAGADPEAEIGEKHEPETHLVPLLLETIDGNRPSLTINGTDYETPDGTCIRDYVHVSDLVDAHVLGLRWLKDGKPTRIFNLGTGRGFSVREVVDAAGAVTNRPVPTEIGPRRPGDAASLVSGSVRAEAELGWTPRRSQLGQMIEDAWRWHRSGGFGP